MEKLTGKSHIVEKWAALNLLRINIVYNRNVQIIENLSDTGILYVMYLGIDLMHREKQR
jgi:hypothetical protein